MSNFCIGALIAMFASMCFIGLGRLHPEHRGFSPPPADARLDIPLWIVLLAFIGMGTLGPLFAIWQAG